MDDNNMQKLDAIKEIIFGENIKEYDKEFKKIRETLTTQKADIQKMVKDIRKEVQDLLKETEKDLKSQVEQFKKDSMEKLSQLDTGKTDREALGDLLIELGKNLKK